MSDNRNDQIDLEAYRVAKEARNLEIMLFWQRSNYFLVLSTAVAVGFFSLRDAKYALPLAIFGLVVGLLWIAVNLGSKFWQSRWEHRLRLTEDPEHRPGWMRVDRVLGEHGLTEDTAATRQEFERRMEARRREKADQAALKSLRRGWYLGSQDFKDRMLEKLDGKLGEHHSGQLRLETAEAKGKRIMDEELRRLGWNRRELALRRKSDPGKLTMAARLRRETTLSLKAIAARVGLGTSKSANARLHEWMKRNQSA